MKAKAAAGIALALTVALVGCSPRGGGGGGHKASPSASPYGGGGGTTTSPRQGTTGANQPGGMAGSPTGNVAGTQGAVSGAAAAHQIVLDATKNASAARTSVAKKDWTTAEADIKRTKQDLKNAEKGASTGMMTSLKDAEAMADKAERAILSKSPNATKDLDQLVTHLNQVAVKEAPVQAGGGMPAAAPAGTTAGLTKKAQDDLRDATKNANAARADVTKKDWNAANKSMNQVQDKLADLSKNATPAMQANLKDAHRMADKAQADIKSHSANSAKSLDNLVTHLNHLESMEVKAGGGKPMKTK